MITPNHTIRRQRGEWWGLLVAAFLASPQLPASDDWDWGGYSELDDAPVVKSTVVESSTGKVAGPAEPVQAENAFPDFSAPPHPAHTLFAGMPAFEVIPSQRNPSMHPCANCHQWVKGNPEPRNLKQPHDDFQLDHGLHGRGKFWCFTCHDLSGKGALKTLEGEPLDFDEAYLLCSQCHADQARDWVYGAHGKRVSNWQGVRQVYSCTACHYQHSPAFKPREPLEGPVMRVGLDRPEHWVAKNKREHSAEDHRPQWEVVDDAVRGEQSGTAGEQRISGQEQGDGEES